MSLRAAWIGLGKIAGHHFEALEHINHAIVAVAGCDPDDAARRRYQDRMPVYISISAMLAEQRPDAVIVASPTPTHTQVCQEVLGVARLHAPKLLLVEKPIAASPPDITRLIKAASDAGVELRGLYHAAYAPEVKWGLSTFKELHSTLHHIESEFFDPYSEEDAVRRTAIYGDSWLDSGINALSIWARFTTVRSISVIKDASLVSTYNAQVDAETDGEPVVGHIFTSWQANAPAKCTRLFLGDDLQLVLNHQATAGQLFRGSELVGAWASTSDISRLASHYLGTFRALLSPEMARLDDTKLLTWLLAGRS